MLKPRRKHRFVASYLTADGVIFWQTRTIIMIRIVIFLPTGPPPLLLRQSGMNHRQVHVLGSGGGRSGFAWSQVWQATTMRNSPNKANSRLRPKPGLEGFNLTKMWRHQRAPNYMVNCRKRDYHQPEEETKIGIWQNRTATILSLLWDIGVEL